MCFSNSLKQPHGDIIEVNSIVLVYSVNKVRKSQVKISVRHVAILYESTRTVTAVTLDKQRKQPTTHVHAIGLHRLAGADFKRRSAVLVQNLNLRLSALA